ncbi:proton-dependent oligopeptide transporter family protein [Tanacetum coccineum]
MKKNFIPVLKKFVGWIEAVMDKLREYIDVLASLYRLVLRDYGKAGRYVETIDVATGLKFNMRAMVLWTINDFLARSSLSRWSGQGYRACHTCNEDAPSVHVLGKTAYVGHKRFLKKPHTMEGVIRIDHQELKKVIWYVLHNSPKIDAYRAKFNSEFPNKDMKGEFLDWFGKQTPISVNYCVVNDVRFVVHSRDERRTTQNSDICSPGLNGEMYYGQLEQILEFSYLSFKTVLFRVKWFDTSNKGRTDPECIHVDNSSNLALSTSLNDMEIAALHIDGQSIDVDAPPDFIDVVDEDDDIIDEETPFLMI